MQNRKYSPPLRLDRPMDYDLHNGMEMTDPYGIRPPTCLWTMNLYPKAIIFLFIARIKCLILVFVCKVIPVVSSFQHISFYSCTSAGLCIYFSLIRVYSSNHLIHVSRIVLLILPRCSLNTCNYLLIWVHLGLLTYLNLTILTFVTYPFDLCINSACIVFAFLPLCPSDYIFILR